MERDDDREIIAAVLRGDIDNYAKILERHGKTVRSIVARRVPREMVDAVAHDVFVRAFQSLDSYREHARFVNWLSRIAVRTCCDYWRRRMRTQSLHVELDEAAELPGSSGMNEHLAAGDARVLLDKVMKCLSAEDRTLVESVYFDNMPLKDVAVAMGWGLVKTKVRAMRARKKMRKVLESIGEMK